MICPIMSRPVTLKLNDNRYDDQPELFVVECRMAGCALWIGTTTYNGDSTGYCAFQATGGS